MAGVKWKLKMLSKSDDMRSRLEALKLSLAIKSAVDVMAVKVKLDEDKDVAQSLKKMDDVLNEILTRLEKDLKQESNDE